MCVFVFLFLIIFFLAICWWDGFFPWSWRFSIEKMGIEFWISDLMNFTYMFIEWGMCAN